MEYSVIDYIIHTDDELRKKVEANVDYQKVLRKSHNCYDKLCEILNDEQKELFNKFVELETDELCVAFDCYFKAGMKVGIRVAAESMFD